MASPSGVSSPGPSRGKRRRTDSEEDPVHDEDSSAKQHYRQNSARDNSRVHNGNVYGNVHYHSPLPPSGSGAKPASQDNSNLLESLRFDQMGDREATVQKPYINTCKWLLQHPQYLEWSESGGMHEHNGILWIKGKPGAGKSTLMKFALENAIRTQQADAIVSFFFNARGDRLENNFQGLYRSLLLQVLEFRPEIAASLKSRHSRRLGQTWSIDELQSFLKDSILQLKGVRLHCYLDALDECSDDNVQDMVDFFEQLGEEALQHDISVRVCFSCRYFPYRAVNNSLQIDLRKQEGHTDDIHKYIHKKLKIGSGSSATAIKVELETRTSGVFLWLCLVIPMLQKAYDSGRIHALRQCLDGVPGDLNRLFADVLARHPGNNSELVLTLQWILFAQRELQVEELYHAILIGTEPDAVKPLDKTNATFDDMRRLILHCSRGLAELTRGKRPVVQFIHETVREYLGQQGGLEKLDPRLAEKLEGHSHDSLRDCCLRFISHEAIVGRVLADAGGNMVPLPTASSSEAKEVRASIKKHIPFFEYAVHGILYHADASEGHAISQDLFVEQFPWSNWVSCTRILQMYEIRRYRNTSVDRMYIFANEGLLNLLLAELDKRQHCAVEVDNERYTTVIEAAAARGSLKAVRALLEQSSDLPLAVRARLISLGAEVRSTDVLQLLLDARIHHGLEDLKETSTGRNRIIRDMQARGRNRHLDQAALIDSLRNYTLYDNEFLPTLLYSAMRDARLDIARTLLEAGWKVDSAHVLMLIDPLDRAQVATSSDPGFWQLLVEHTADDPVLRSVVSTMKGRRLVEVEDFSGEQIDPGMLMRSEEPYQISESKDWLAPDRSRVRKAMATRNGIEVLATVAITSANHEMLQLLLQEGLDPGFVLERFDHPNGTPLLHMACARGDLGSIKILLEAGAIMRTHATASIPTLSVACRNGHHRIVKLLIQRGIDTVDAPTVRTELESAVSRGHFDMVRALLGRELQSNGLSTQALGDDLGFAGDDAGPTHTQPSCPDVIQSVETTNMSRSFVSSYTPLWDYGMVELILSKGVSPDVYLSTGQTLLQIVCGQGNERVAKLLLDRGANVNLVSSADRRSTALSWACKNGHVNIVRLLLKRKLGPPVWQLRHALEEVCLHGRSDILCMLIAAGAGVSDPGGILLLSARMNGHQEIIEILQRATTSRRDGPASELSR